MAQAPLAMLNRFTAEKSSVSERVALGKALRKQVPRSSQSGWQLPAKRQDPVAVIQAQNRDRLAKLVALRNARMLASPFAFFRGSAQVMAQDLAHTVVSGLDVVACGDMHVANFGMFGSAERNLVFAINDFDEVHPGYWEWDLKRLATSAVLAVRDRGGSAGREADAARATVSSYRKHMRRYAGMSYLEVWYDLIDEKTILQAMPPGACARARQMLDRARRRGHVHTLDKLTEHVDGEHRIIEDVPVIIREETLADGTPIRTAVDAMLRQYLASLPPERRRLLSRYRLVDVARKVVGVGSVGTSCWVLLMQGVDEDDPLFLQVKQANASVLAPHVPWKMEMEGHGHRVVSGQRMIQGSPDIFLGWGRNDLADYYVRQLADMKGSFEFESGQGNDAIAFEAYCRLCGRALALAHAKSGDPAKIAGYCGSSEALDDAILGFALAYAATVESDFGRMQDAVRRGKLAVAPAS